MTRPARGSRSLRASEEVAARAGRVLWKGGSEATQHPSLRAAGFPRFLARGEDCRVWDVDGNCYVDYLMSWGTVLLGHRHPAVEEAVRKQLERGALFNLSVEQEVSLAERLVEHIPAAELVRFVASGSEATGAALRIARAATGREGVLRYGYHGWLDWCLGEHPAGIPPATLAAVQPLPYNDLEAVGELFARRGEEIACVILEPVKDEEPAEGFLAGLRSLAHRHGALLVFDEVKTGLRFGLGGAQGHYGVTPDLCVLSKALANGYPLAAVAGTRAVFARAEDVWISGTYHGWPPAVAAAHATLTVLESEPVIERVWALGARLRDGFNAVLAERGFEARLAGAPPMPELRCPEHERKTLLELLARLVERGQLLHPVRPCFVSGAHTPELVDRTLEELEAAARRLVAS